MGRSSHSAGFSADGLLSILFLIVFVAGVPVLIKQARDAGQVLTAMVNDQITARL